MLKAVVDTNQFVSALINTAGPSAQLLEAWRDQRFILILSRGILEEIGEVLQYSRIKEKYGLSQEAIKAFLYLLEHEAIVIQDTLEINVIDEDPDDNKVLACALFASVDYIVSGDGHLLSLNEFEGIPVVKVKDFLKLL